MIQVLCKAEEVILVDRLQLNFVLVGPVWILCQIVFNHRPHCIVVEIEIGIQLDFCNSFLIETLSFHEVALKKFKLSEFCIKLLFLLWQVFP